MTEKKTIAAASPAAAKKVSATSTKQELLDAYNSLLQEIQEKKSGEMKPEEKREEKKQRQVLAAVEGITTEGIEQGIAALKGEVGQVLTRLAENLAQEFQRLDHLKQALAVKDEELQELYQIDKAAATLAALIEAQNRKRAEFEEEMRRRKEELEEDIDALSRQLSEERKKRESETKEWTTVEKQRRDREREEFQYAFEREKKLLRDQFADEKDRLDKEIQERKEQLEKGLSEREKSLAAQEAELADLRKRVAAFPKELEIAVAQAVQVVTERFKAEGKYREDLMKKDFEGEKNVLATKITSLEKTVKEQADHIVRLGQQLEKAYQKIEEVAVKTIEGSSQAKAFTGLQQLLSDQLKKQQQ